MTVSPRLAEPANVLYRIKRGLSGYVSYLAACEMNESFSEYVLYEPILRILTARGYVVECEVECPGMPRRPTGDRKRIDFVASGPNARVALEVKWANRQKLDIAGDHSKLAAFLVADRTARGFLCVFGRKSIVGGLSLRPDVFVEQGRMATADLGITKYSCRVFELTSVDNKPINRASRVRSSRSVDAQLNEC